jgi:hypothetical protein
MWLIYKAAYCPLRRVIGYYCNMARLLPTDTSEFSLSMGETAELRTLGALRAGLAATYTVIPFRSLGARRCLSNGFWRGGFRNRQSIR